MSCRSQDDHFVTPTGALIHEPTFPNLSGPLPDPAEGAKLKLSAAAGDSPAGGSQSDIEQHSKNSHKAPASTAQQEDSTPRPTQQRWATERPKPSAKHSLLGKHHLGPRSKNSTPKPAAVEFDPYSSESDSSDDDALPAQSSSNDNELAREVSRNRKSVASGPFSRLKLANDHFRTSGKISKSDGRLKLSLLEKDADSGYLAKALGAVLSKHSKNDDDTNVSGYDRRDIHAQKISPEDDEMENEPSRRVKLNIVIIIIGSRGDIQPFIRIGKILQDDYGHRVRMATHPAFKDFVEKDSGLEFFSIGGNPAELMAFMVKNPGLIPNLDTIKEGEVGRRRAQMYEMFQGMWRACINATDDETDKMNAKMMGDKPPFVADAIIAVSTLNTRYIYSVC
jgi:hypothetical protein